MATALSTPLAPEISVEEYIARFVDGGDKPTCEYMSLSRTYPTPSRAATPALTNPSFFAWRSCPRRTASAP